MLPETTSLKVRVRRTRVITTRVDNRHPSGTKVSIESHFTDDELLEQCREAGPILDLWGYDKEGVPRGDPAQRLPILGRLVAHGVGNYWVSVILMALKGGSSD